VLNPGDTLNVSCALVAGTPAPAVTWSLPPAMTSSYDVTAGGGRLVVTSVRREDGGVYRCAARNVVGEDFRVFTIVVRGESSSKVK